MAEIPTARFDLGTSGFFIMDYASRHIDGVPKPPARSDFHFGSCEGASVTVILNSETDLTPEQCEAMEPVLTAYAKWLPKLLSKGGVDPVEGKVADSERFTYPQ